MKSFNQSSLLIAAFTLARLVQSSPLIFSSTDLDQRPLNIDTTGQLVNGLDAPYCDCNGTIDTGDRRFICGDPRLGPIYLPNKFPLLGIISSYDRFGGLQPGKFLGEWWDSSSSRKWPGHPEIKGSWRWPEMDGFLRGPGDSVVNATTILQFGTILDRFGSTSGKFMAAADGPFNQRALPPSSLNADSGNTDWPADYNVYKVISPLEVSAGVVAPWFGQPGLGTQFNIGAIGNVKTLIERNYIQRISKSELADPHDRTGGGKCGQGVDPAARKAAAE